MTAQLSFDFGAAIAARLRAQHPMEAETRQHGDAYWLAQGAAARNHWRVGMVASLPCFSDVQGIGQRYTHMQPGIVEAIYDDTSSVRIYVAPEYGSWIGDCPLHLALAINVPLRELGKRADPHLLRIAGSGQLAAGDPDLAVEVRERGVHRSASEIGVIL